jgi:hypothetical protein
LARSVQVGKDRVQQRRALLQGGFNSAPFAMVDDQRHRVQRPRAIGGRRIAIHIVGDAVVMEQPTAFLPATEQTIGADGRQRVDQRVPMRPNGAVGGDEFIVKGGVGLVLPRRRDFVRSLN